MITQLLNFSFIKHSFIQNSNIFFILPRGFITQHCQDCLFQDGVEFYYVMASMLLKWSVVYKVQWEVGEYMTVVLHFKYHLLSPGPNIGLAR